jgi:cytochrome c556
MKRLQLAMVVLAGIVVASQLWTSIVAAQVKKGKERPAATKYLMRGIMQPNCAALGKLFDGDGPADEKAWDAAAGHAACLSEMSYLLMDDGRCPDGTWADAASSTLRQGSADVLAAVEEKDLAAAKTAFGNMTKACAACHETHKKAD